MKAYCATGPITIGNANKTLLAIFSTATRRPKLLQVIIGCVSASLTDVQAQFAIKKITSTTGASSSNGICGPTEEADGLPICTAQIVYTNEPTYLNGDVVDIPLHMRNSWIWTPPTLDSVITASLLGAQPPVSPTRSPIIGIGIQLVSGPIGGAYVCSAIWDE